jgi:DUF1680 family protein
MDATRQTELAERRDEAIAWILRAQQATPDGGVSAYYHVSRGWCPTSYPEVTGYVIPTMWDRYHATEETRLRKAALDMTEWITSVQRADGSVTAMDFETPYVFDTGQDIFGWVRSYRETGDSRWLDAAVRAGRWLVASQSDDGSWTTTPTSGATHTYHARVSWALLRLAEVTGDRRFDRIARRNLDWVVRQQESNGWFRIPPKREMTHFLAYTVRGLLESARATGEALYFDAAVKMALPLRERVGDNGYLCGWFEPDWSESSGSCCLTGSLQFAIIWLLLYRETGEAAYFDAAERVVRYVAGTQRNDSSDEGVRGAIAGSEPLDGEYGTDCYLAWATKFFVDAVSLLERTTR